MRRVFKENANFWNSAPTGRGSALRLQSTPSGRFNSKLPFCRVSLWPFVGELQPKKRARAQAFRRTSDTEWHTMTRWRTMTFNGTQRHAVTQWNTNQELDQQRVCVFVNICYKLGKTFTETEISQGQGNAVLKKRPELWENQTWTWHHDNAPAYLSLLVRSYPAKDLTLTPYFPELVRAGCSALFKQKLRWKDVVSKRQRKFKTMRQET